jgi:Zn-dependent protease
MTSEYFEYFVEIVVLLFSITIHESAHGYVAYLRGDDTAKMSGRITLNPIAHLELFGSIILPAVLIFTKAPITFAWAKPCPYNPQKLKNPKIDVPMLAFAGPASNLLLAFFSGLAIRLLVAFPNFTMGFGTSIERFFALMVIINVNLAVFNMTPIPPLDGSKVMAYLLPPRLAAKYLNLNPYIGFIMLCLVLSSDMVEGIISPIRNFFMMLFTGWTF